MSKKKESQGGTRGISPDARAGDGGGREATGRTSRASPLPRAHGLGVESAEPQEPQGSLLVKTERARGLSVLRGLQLLFSFSYIIYLFM